MPPPTGHQAADPGVDPTDGNVYTMAEAARLKGVSTGTVERAVKQGRLPAQRVGRMFFLSGADLRAWRPMVQRAPRRYGRREPDPAAVPVPLKAASAERRDEEGRLATMLEAARRTAALPPIDDFLPWLCERLAAELGFERVTIVAPDRGQEPPLPLAAFGRPAGEPPASNPASSPTTVDGVAEGGGAAVAGIDEFVAPLRVGERVLAVLRADRAGAPRAFAPDQLAFAQGVVDVAALALELARLRAGQPPRSGGEPDRREDRRQPVEAPRTAEAAGPRAGG